MALGSDFDCWYDNGFGAAQWGAEKDGWVKGCALQLTEERLVLVKGKASVFCPWAGVTMRQGVSTRGNAILTVTLGGEKGGTADLAIEDYSPNAFWAELWRVVEPMRARMASVRPEVLALGASYFQFLDYLGGYPLHASKSFKPVRVEADQYGVSVVGAVRSSRRLMLLPWKDITDLSIEGMMDAQRQRSLARTVEFGTLGGLAGKKVKSAYMTVTTDIGAAVFHTDKMTAPQLQAKYAAVLAPARVLIAARNAAQAPEPPAPAPPAAPPVSVADELAKLASLKADGILTEEEFAAQKARLLSA